MLINLAYVCREVLVPILRFPFRLRSALFVACLAALFAPGCSSADDCSQGETRCDGNRIEGCPTDYITSRKFSVPAGDCGAAMCINTRSGSVRRAACSTSGKLDDRCAGKDGPTCANETTFLDCQQGYSSHEATCACNATSFTRRAFCALAPTPDPKCSGDSTCDGNTILECLDGYAIARTPCAGVAPLCVRQSNGAQRGFCAKEETCTGVDGTTCSADKSRAEGCVSGHVVSSNCASGKHCSVYDIYGGPHEVACIQ